LRFALKAYSCESVVKRLNQRVSKGIEDHHLQQNTMVRRLL
jgi:hypothetical protein